MKNSEAKIYTDGSCHTQLLIGAWAALVFLDGKKCILKGLETNTTHNRMELLAVINAVNYLDSASISSQKIEIFSDSQYVVNLIQRKEKLKSKNFITNKGTPIQNNDLVQTLINQIETHNLVFSKVKAHQKNGDPLNREVDMIVRNLVREKIKNDE